MTLEVINDTSRVINYTTRVMPQFVASLSLINYDRNMFIVQATVVM